VHRALLLTSDSVVSVPPQWLVDDPAASRTPLPSADCFDLSLMETKVCVLDQFERVYLSRALAQSSGNVSDAASLWKGTPRGRQAAQESVGGWVREDPV
jgi:hypothetical protein